MIDEILVSNIKVMKVERDYLWKRYTFIPASKEDEKFLNVFNKYIDELEKENSELKDKIKNMEKAEKDFMYILKKYILNEWSRIKIETLYDICFEWK